ncbi:MAG TPA: thiamine-phosphate kinase, partial [Bryobacteraceae bacterium]|nr:thiamine-phosphate kinase [Bryobacteraceae bacterium]
RSQPAPVTGHRALARSLSDIAAMGADPRFCLVSVAAPDLAWVDRFYDGLLALAARTRTQLAGGDLAKSARITLDVMVCGVVPRGRALRRDTAKPGDHIYVSGPLGRLDFLHPGKFEPRLALGRKLRKIASACMDLSDGLSLDLHRLCRASGVSAQLDTIPVAPGATLEQALHGGEDYELLFTSPSETNLQGVARIGTIFNGAPGAVFLDGGRIIPAGWDHFENKMGSGRVSKLPGQ